MVFQGGFMVYHGFWLVSIVLLVENTTKLCPGPTIQSRPCRPKAGFGLVMMMIPGIFTYGTNTYRYSFRRYFGCMPR